MIELLGDIFSELLPTMLRHLGASVKWLFLRNKLSYKELYAQSWNLVLGLTVLVAVIIALVYLI